MDELPHITYPRILFYAINGLGMGHVTRLLAIARAVRDRRPGAQILFLTTSEGNAVIFREGFASVKIPSRSIIARSGIWGATYAKLAHTLTTNTIAAFNPAIMVVDTVPAGTVHELLLTLSWEMRRVFVYRAQQQERTSDPFFQSALSHYHLAIVPHTEGEEAILAPEELPLVWTGPILIRDKTDALARDAARARLGLPEDGKLLYITTGGGGDKEMAEATPAVFRAAKAAGWSTVAPEAPLESTSPGAAPDYRIHYYPMGECLNAFDAAVSAAGYNSVAELLHMGVPTVLIPRARVFDDQFARAHAAQKAGAALVASLDEADLLAQLNALKDEKLRKSLSTHAQAHVAANGAGIAADAILGML